jgi:hypothetical protein
MLLLLANLAVSIMWSLELKRYISRFLDTKYSLRSALQNVNYQCGASSLSVACAPSTPSTDRNLPVFAVEPK